LEQLGTKLIEVFESKIDSEAVTAFLKEPSAEMITDDILQTIEEEHRK